MRKLSMKDIIATVLDKYRSREAKRIITDTFAAMDEEAVDPVFADRGDEGAAHEQNGILEKDNGDGTVTLTLNFSYHPNKYDSMVAPKDDARREQDAIEEQDVVDEDADSDVSHVASAKAEDAAPLPSTQNAAPQCAATFAQCQAKNPYACRFHGVKLMEGDLNALLAQNGVTGAHVAITEQKHAGTFSATVRCAKKDVKAVRKAMTAFSKNPGIDAGSFSDFGYSNGEYEAMYDVDALNQAATAQTPTHQQMPPQSQKKPRTKAAGPTKPPVVSAIPQQQPATVAAPPSPPQPAFSIPTSGGRLHPPAPPTEPPAWNGLSDDEISYLDKTSMDLAFLMQRVNYNIGKGSPGAGTMAAQNYDAIDRTKLDDLAKKDSTGQAAKLLALYDDAAKSKANGWKDQIQQNTYDGSQYNSADPKGAVGYAQWGFDGTKCPKDPYASARKAFAEYEPPSKKRADELARYQGMASALQHGKDKTDADAALKDMSAASEEMGDIEENISLLDDAIAKEQDPSAKKELEGVLAAVEGIYFVANERVDKAKKVLKAIAAKQSTMSEGYSYDDIEMFYKSRGLVLPYGVRNWKTFITDQTLQSNAENTIMSNTKFSSRPLWQTHQQRLDRIAQLRKNLSLLMPHLHIYHCADRFIEQSLVTDGAVRANSGSFRYQDALRNAFGTPKNKKATPQDMQLYCVVSLESNPFNSSWNMGRPYYVELDPQKTHGGICWDNGCGYWSSSSPKGMNHITEMNFSDIAYGGGSNAFNPEAAEVDFDGMTPAKMFSIMFKHGDSAYEFHAVNGGVLETGNIKAVWSVDGKIPSSMKSVLSKNGVATLDNGGNSI